VLFIAPIVALAHKLGAPACDPRRRRNSHPIRQVHLLPRQCHCDRCCNRPTSFAAVTRGGRADFSMRRTTGFKRAGRSHRDRGRRLARRDLIKAAWFSAKSLASTFHSQHAAPLHASYGPSPQRCTSRRPLLYELRDHVGRMYLAPVAPIIAARPRANRPCRRCGSLFAGARHQQTFWLLATRCGTIDRRALINLSRVGVSVASVCVAICFILPMSCPVLTCRGITLNTTDIRPLRGVRVLESELPSPRKTRAGCWPDRLPR